MFVTGAIDGNITLENNGDLNLSGNASVNGAITINYGCYVDADIPLGAEKSLLINPQTQGGVIEKTGQGTLDVSCSDYLYCNIENEQGRLCLFASPMEGCIENDATLIFDIAADCESYCDNIVSGSGNLIKNGEGSLWLNLDYTGTITINDGSLVGQVSCSGPISIGAGASLVEYGTGTISGAISGQGRNRRK